MFIFGLHDKLKWDNYIEIQSCIEKARTAYMKLVPTLRSHRLNLQTKIKAYEMLCFYNSLL